jgi:hypothetical protein
MTDAHDATRRKLVIAASAAGAGLLLTAGNAGLVLAAQKGHGKGQEKEVGAVEDLMREHGVLRRALLVYSESVLKIRANLGGIPAEALMRTAKLFRSFGEDYHERKLEEAYIFPAIKKAGGPAAGYADVLKAQHDRGREVTRIYPRRHRQRRRWDGRHRASRTRAGELRADVPKPRRARGHHRFLGLERGAL